MTDGITPTGLRRVVTKVFAVRHQSGALALLLWSCGLAWAQSPVTSLSCEMVVGTPAVRAVLLRVSVKENPHRIANIIATGRGQTAGAQILKATPMRCPDCFDITAKLPEGVLGGTVFFHTYEDHLWHQSADGKYVRYGLRCAPHRE
jgi:hypothetical protein